MPKRENQTKWLKFTRKYRKWTTKQLFNQMNPNFNHLIITERSEWGEGKKSNMIQILSHLLSMGEDSFFTWKCFTAEGLIYLINSIIDSRKYNRNQECTTKWC